MGYSDITDQELDSIICSHQSTHTNDGENMITGCLVSLGIHLQRRIIRESIHIVDHNGVQERAFTTIRRRRYHADSPNSVWHLDGNHKLIRYKFVIHGAVDGFSRLIFFLKYSTNNRAGTVLQCFILMHGTPQMVCTDLGGKNVDVWHHMIQLRGASHDSATWWGQEVCYYRELST